MRTSFFNSPCLISKQRRWLTLPVAAGLLVVAAMMVVSQAYNLPAASRSATLAAAMPGPAANAKPDGPQRGPVQVVRFTLYDVGIYPPEVVVDKGNVAVAIEDLSGGESHLVIERDNGQGRERVDQVDHEDHQPRGRKDLKMTPGRYEVYMADHPENRAVLIVEP